MDQLPDFDDDTPLSERFLYPGDWWGSDDGMDARDHQFLVIEQLAEADIVAITDNDADGLGSAAIIHEAFPDQTVVHIESGHNNDGLDTETALETVAQYCPGGVEVFITDLCLDDDGLDTYLDEINRIQQKCTVHLFDHHEWSDAATIQMEQVTDTLVIAEDDVCAADITFDELKPRMQENNPDAVDRMEALARVTRDHDLYIKEIDKSDDLSDFSFWGETEEYIEAVRTHGPDIMDDPDVAEMLENEREEKEQRIQLAVENAEWYEVEGRDVALAYGDVYHSEVGQRLVTGEGNAATAADMAVIIKPWNKVSLRSDEECPYCAAFASLLDGGGHVDAAGCKTDALGTSGYRTYTEHWEEEGETVKRIMLELLRIGFQRVDAGEIEVDVGAGGDSEETDTSESATDDATADA